MNVLYVIGNGFDRWHDLPTSYLDFYNCHCDSLEAYSEYFSLGPDQEKLWHNFESDLGRFDWSSFYDSSNHTDPMAENFRPSEVYGLEDDLNQQAEELVDHFDALFTEWIESIDINTTQVKFPFVSNARYLSFNYTSLLNSPYGIDHAKIRHIHGSVKNYDSLVFGHGLSIREEPEMDEEGNSNRHMFWDAEGAAKYPLYRFKKPVSEILGREQKYFESLRDVDAVVVLGHSLNDIDLPYFERIFSVASKSHWIVSFHGEQERAAHLQQLKKCHLSPSQIKLNNIDDIPNILASLQTNLL